MEEATTAGASTGAAEDSEAVGEAELSAPSEVVSPVLDPEEPETVEVAGVVELPDAADTPDPEPEPAVCAASPDPDAPLPEGVPVEVPVEVPVGEDCGEPGGVEAEPGGVEAEPGGVEVVGEGLVEVPPEVVAMTGETGDPAGAEVSSPLGRLSLGYASQ